MARRAVQFSPSPSPLEFARDIGPFDIIGDVHGCAAELVRLLRRLGYRRPSPRRAFRHPGGRRAVFLGDLVDRGPGVVRAMRIAMRMVAEGSALSVPGNHEVTVLRALQTGARKGSAGTLKTIRQIRWLPAAARRRFVERFRAFVEGLPPHLVLDRGRLAVAHAGIRPEHLGTDSPEGRRFSIHGQTTGETDRYGLPVRVNWAADYSGKPLVVYGHTPVGRPEWIGRTVNIDTGCVYGGSLTALRYPEMKLVSVKAARAYYRPRRSLPGGVGLRAETRSRAGAPAFSVTPPVPPAEERPLPFGSRPQSPDAPPRSRPAHRSASRPDPPSRTESSRE
jgi:protein phosphatase